MLFKSGIIAILIASHIILTGCENSQKPASQTTPPAQVPVEQPTLSNEVIFLDQGLSEDDRLTFYYLSQGSQLLPYFWFLALEKSDDQTLFRSANNMRTLGFIPQAKSPGMNPDGLPIGFVKNDDPATVSHTIKKEFLGPDYDTSKYPPTNTWLGFTCANCHTFEISYENRKIRIDGSSSHADHQAFLEQLIDALQATTRSVEKMTRFAHLVLDSNWNQGEQDALKQRVEAYTPILEKLRDQNKTEHRYGPGRLDAFGAIFNRVLETSLEIPENHVPSNAPVSYPFLWDTPHLDWVQYNSSAGNAIARNVGEVLGVYGHLQLQGTPETGQFDSTIRFENLDKLEGYVARLKAPAWPVELLGNIDSQKTALGRQLYAQNCVQCHTIRDENGKFPMTTENKGGVQFIKTVSQMPLTELGTDPQMIQNFLQYKADPGVLKTLLTVEEQKLENNPRVSILKVAVGGVVKRKLSETEFQGDELKELAFRLSGQRTEPFITPPLSILSTYRARPLNGIWATAPFLHNGSVPNLYQLLVPAEQRIKTFNVGTNQFDPINVGFVTDKGFEFNATLQGNSNSGHSGPQFTQTKTANGSYRDFTDEERMALIEYMKTLI